jgi:ABC-2 type transport system ATP-binding protein
MALTADHLIVVGRGRLIADTSVDEFISRVSADIVQVRSPQAAELSRLLAPHAGKVESGAAGLIEVHGLVAAQIGEIASANGIVLHELTPQQASLEEAFMALTSNDVEFRTQAELEEAAA